MGECDGWDARWQVGSKARAAVPALSHSITAGTSERREEKAVAQEQRTESTAAAKRGTQKGGIKGFKGGGRRFRSHQTIKTGGRETRDEHQHRFRSERNAALRLTVVVVEVEVDVVDVQSRVFADGRTTGIYVLCPSIRFLCTTRRMAVFGRRVVATKDPHFQAQGTGLRRGKRETKGDGQQLEVGGSKTVRPRTRVPECQSDHLYLEPPPDGMLRNGNWWRIGTSKPNSLFAPQRNGMQLISGSQKAHAPERG